MKSKAVAGIVFANANDSLLSKLTEKRAMASVPFGSRYRLIDFSLSNLVNAGVSNIGLLTTGNYRSLMDHVANGIYWDLDRRNGGLHILAPYMAQDVRRFRGTIDALSAATDFINRCESDYIVLCAADILANVNISDLLETHIETGADITVVYHNGILPANRNDAMDVTVDEKGNVTAIGFDAPHNSNVNYAIGITVISRDLLSRLIEDAVEKDYQSFNRDILAKRVNDVRMMGYEHKEFVTLMNGMDTYYDAHKALLDSNVRRQLFNRERPIYTKTRDDMPTRYGIDADVKNSLIGDGCVIEGTVKNSVLARGVKVGKGAVVENCILMQETNIGDGVTIENVIADKNVVIGDDVIIKATADNRMFISKNQTI